MLNHTSVNIVPNCTSVHTSDNNAVFRNFWNTSNDINLVLRSKSSGCIHYIQHIVRRHLHFLIGKAEMQVLRANSNSNLQCCRHTRSHS